MTANSEGTGNTASATSNANSRNDWHNDQLVDIKDLLSWHQMPNKVTDTEKVTVEKVIRYFTNGAWIAVNNCVEHLKKNRLRICRGCSSKLSLTLPTCCYYCLE